MIEGKQYVLMLNKGIEDAYYGVIEPWQFKIVGDKVNVVSNIQSIKLKDMNKMTLEELLELVS